MAESVWTFWSPPFAPHVVGSYTEREHDAETGTTSAQLWQAECTKCGAKWGPVTCEQGIVRQHISRFAISAHMHADPLEPRTAQGLR